MKKSFFGVYLLLLLFSAVLVQGQGFTGPVTGGPVTVGRPIPVSEARNLPKNSWVTLTGNIVNALPGGKYFTLRDSSGEITVEIGSKEWRGVSAGPSDMVEVCGDVEIKNGQVRIEVKAIAGPGQTLSGLYTATVSQVKNSPHNSWVIISGNVVNSVGKEKFTFRDSSGEITVEIERDTWRGLSVDASDRVEISGKIKVKKRDQVSIEVEAVRKI